VKTRQWMALLIPVFLGIAACAADVAHEKVADETDGAAELTVIDIPNPIVIEDSILSGGQPDEAQLRAAADAGYRTIVNTRGTAELEDFAFEEELVRSLGMEYVMIPIGSGEPVDEDKARTLAEILAQPDARPAMVHCRSGNRVGALFAAKAFVVDGLDADAALKLGAEYGMRRVPEELETIMKGGGGD